MAQRQQFQGTGFFNTFHTSNYCAKLYSYPDEHLFAQAQSKQRQQSNSQMWMILGIFLGIITIGHALPVAFVNWRIYGLSTKKLYLIKQELQRRGYQVR